MACVVRIVISSENTMTPTLNNKKQATWVSCGAFDWICDASNSIVRLALEIY
jgi:hypothetical protein